MLIFQKGNNNPIQVYYVTVMTHVKALQVGQSSQGTSEPITPVLIGAIKYHVHTSLANLRNIIQYNYIIETVMNYLDHRIIIWILHVCVNDWHYHALVFTLSTSMRKYGGDDALMSSQKKRWTYFDMHPFQYLLVLINNKGLSYFNQYHSHHYQYCKCRSYGPGW